MCETSQEISLMLRNRGLFFDSSVNFEFEYFLNEDTKGVLTDLVMHFHDRHILKHVKNRHFT